MLGRAKHRLHWLGILLALFASDASAQPTGSIAKVVTWQSPSANGEVYAGILGEIAKPGVYRLEAGGLSLQNVIRRAGGLTEEASGTIRIVRQDRVVESFFFSPQANIALLAGDLLVIESKRTQAALSRQYETDPRMRALYAGPGADDRLEKPSSGAGVQVAFLNVLDRPVIVKLKHENARVGHVVQMLDQPIELAQAVRVIGPDRLLAQNGAPQPIDASLADGSVLVFPRNLINRAKLPSFPVPYESEIATGAGPAIIGGSPELRNVGQLPPMMSRQPDAAARYAPPAMPSAPITLPSVPESTIQLPPPTERLEIPQAIQAPLVSSPPRIATIPFTGERRITSSSRQVPTPGDHQPERVEEPKREKIRESSLDNETVTDAKGAHDHPTHADNDDPFADEEPTTVTASGKDSSLSLGLVLGVIAFCGLLIGVALLTRRYFDRQRLFAPGLLAEIDAVLQQRSGTAPMAVRADAPHEPAAKASPEPQEATVERSVISAASTWFNQLLKNQLPIRHEKAEFPTEISLQGRLVPQPIFRIDAAASPVEEGPHFPVSEITSGSKPVEVAAHHQPERVIDNVERAHSSRPSQPHFLKRRPGENTVAAAAAASGVRTNVRPSEAPQPEFKNSTTPVADALRHLQGGQQ